MPRKIWGGIQFRSIYNERIFHYRIDCLILKACNRSRGKCAGVRGPPQPIENSKTPNPSSDIIIRTRECVLHVIPASRWNSTHHQCRAPGLAPMDRTSDVSEAGTTPMKVGPQRIPTGRMQTCPVQLIPQYNIPAPSPLIPVTATYGRQGRTQSTPPRKTRRNSKHAGDTHQKDQMLPQSTLLFYMWI